MSLTRILNVSTILLYRCFESPELRYVWCEETSACVSPIITWLHHLLTPTCLSYELLPNGVCPEMRANEIHELYDRHHKVSPNLNPH